jgi:hypothetical protein
MSSLSAALSPADIDVLLRTKSVAEVREVRADAITRCAALPRLRAPTAAAAAAAGRGARRRRG